MDVKRGDRRRRGEGAVIVVVEVWEGILKTLRFGKGSSVVFWDLTLI